jgi:inward rectifier potassium channel
VGTLKPTQTFFDARGRPLIERRNLGGSLRDTIAKDAYHLMRTASGLTITALMFAVFLVLNLLFALVYYLGPGQIQNAHGFLDHFWFSVQTLGTIGYGAMTPGNTFANAVVMIESFVGIIQAALITGIVFSRFSTPTARVMFSRVAIIGDHDGKRTLMFRMANERATAIVEATIRVYVTRDEKTSTGESVRRIYDLPLRRATSPIFNLSWVCYHTIDDASPLFGVTPESMATNGMNLIVTFQGIDDQLAATVHTRYAYNNDDIVLDHRFVDIFKTDPETKRRYLDFAPFHDTEPVAPRAA